MIKSGTAQNFHGVKLPGTRKRRGREGQGQGWRFKEQ